MLNYFYLAHRKSSKFSPWEAERSMQNTIRANGARMVALIIRTSLSTEKDPTETN